MSAFVVDNSTIHKVIAYLRQHPDIMPGQAGDHIQSKHDRFQTGPREVGKPRRDAWGDFGAELRLLNVAAVQFLYGDMDQLPGLIGEDCYAHRDVASPSIIVAHKALGCLLYQCAEGKIPETELYKTLEKTHAAMASRIVCNIPAWQSASWG